MKTFAHIILSLVFTTVTGGAITLDEFPAAAKSSVEVELARRDYQTLLYSTLRADPVINQEFPGVFRLAVTGGNNLKLQFYRVTSPSIQRRIVDLVKQTLPETRFVAGRVEFYEDRIEESNPPYRSLTFISLLTEFSVSSNAE